MLGASAHICGHLIYAHAATDKLMYVGATAAALGPCVAPLIRSMTSKVLPPAERGWLNRLLTLLSQLNIKFLKGIKTKIDLTIQNKQFLLHVIL